MPEDHQLDFGVHQFVARAGDQPEHTAQQEIDESEEHGPNLHEKGGRSYEWPGRGDDQRFVCPSGSKRASSGPTGGAFVLQPIGAGGHQQNRSR